MAIPHTFDQHGQIRIPIGAFISFVPNRKIYCASATLMAREWELELEELVYGRFGLAATIARFEDPSTFETVYKEVEQ